MTTVHVIDQGRELLRKQEWSAAFSKLTAPAPFEASRTGVLTALACRGLGDEDAAKAELTAAREVFERLGALPDLAQTEALMNSESTRAGWWVDVTRSRSVASHRSCSDEPRNC